MSLDNAFVLIEGHPREKGKIETPTCKTDTWGTRGDESLRHPPYECESICFMAQLDPNAEQATPHEAGHILISKAVGIPARGLDVEVIRLPNNQGIQVGNFATLTYDPPDDALPTLDPKARASLMLIISGGVAGQMFARIRMMGEGAGDDRRCFERLKSPGSTVTFEDCAKNCQRILFRHKRHFWQLVALIRTRYAERILSNREVQTGRYNLATEADFDNIFGEKPNPK